MRNNPPDPQAPHILCVNPWIHDFAAYDFWAKPYGLLCLAAFLREQGARVSYIDCLDRFHPLAPPADPHARHGRGPYRKAALARPPGLDDVDRTYSRYGIAPQWLRQDLAGLGHPDLILVTSLMTYWYPGVFETIRFLKEAFPRAPLVLGGIYARLCAEHAEAHSGADLVVTDNGRSLSGLVARFTGWRTSAPFDPGHWAHRPYPAYDLQRRMNCIPILTARGCPFDCAYCASRFLEPEMCRRTPSAVLAEIAHWRHRHGARDFAFYDDALLVDAERHAIPILEGLVRIKGPVFFHTPNAVHIRSITRQTARLMYAAGFHTLRLGLETTAFEQRSPLDGKVTREEFQRAVRYLKEAGFQPAQVGAYLLVGLPDQSFDAVRASIAEVKAAGITPVLAHYSPIPHTRLWERAVAISRYDLKADPIFCNNAIFPCQREKFSWPMLSALKQLVQV